MPQIHHDIALTGRFFTIRSLAQPAESYGPLERIEIELRSNGGMGVWNLKECEKFDTREQAQSVLDNIDLVYPKQVTLDGKEFAQRKAASRISEVTLRITPITLGYEESTLLRAQAIFSRMTTNEECSDVFTGYSQKFATVPPLKLTQLLPDGMFQPTSIFEYGLLNLQSPASLVTDVCMGASQPTMSIRPSDPKVAALLDAFEYGKLDLSASLMVCNPIDGQIWSFFQESDMTPLWLVTAVATDVAGGVSTERKYANVRTQEYFDHQEGFKKFIDSYPETHRSILRDAREISIRMGVE